MNSNPTGTSIPPKDNGQSTMAPGSATMAPGSATMAPGQATMAPGSATAAPGAAPKASHSVSSISMIPEYPEYVINGIRYKMCPAESAKTLAKKSGEAKIFVVENGGKRYVIKLYIPGHSPNHDILEAVKQAGGGFFITVYDHGTWADPKHPGVTLDYEIMEYAPYGSLADMKLDGDEKRFKEVAWRMAWCIRQCHEARILHRDIKPENFLFTDSARTKFVVTDFGIARRLTGKGSIKVDTAKSSYFVSPEGSMSSKDRTTYVGPATDWYSMGMTLLALWMGLDNFYQIFPYDQLEELDRLKLNNKVISEIGDMLNMSRYSRSLLERLLEPGDEMRAGYEEIERWYKGETLKTGSAAEAASSATGSFHVVFDENKGLVAHSREELAQMMLADMAFAKIFLYKGLAKNALQTSFPRLAGEIDDIPQRLFPRPDEQVAGVYAACYLLDQSMPFKGIDGNACVTAKEIAAEIWNHRDVYAGTLQKKAQPLWAYLNTRTDTSAGSLCDKFQPLIAKGDGRNGLYALAHHLDNTVMPICIGTGKPIARKDLAITIWDHRNNYVKELADPAAMIYTYLAGLGPNGLKLKQTYPERIKSKGLPELYSLCLAIDRDMPYIGKKYNKIRTQQELADELWDNLSDYCKELSNPDHLLWRFMRTWSDSWASVAQSYPSLIKTCSDEYTFDLIYRLDPKKPFTVEYADDRGKWHSVRSYAEILKAARERGLTDFSVLTMTRHHFQTWMSVRPDENDRQLGALLTKLVKEHGSKAADRAWQIFYTLSPKADYFMKEGGEAYSADQLAKLIEDEVNHVVKTTTFTDQLLKMGSGTCRLEQYMTARKMDRHVAAIRKVMDIQANIKAHPSAPYCQETALWKVIALLGRKPVCRLRGTKKSVSTLAEVKALSQDDRNSFINHGLGDFCTLFFHEDVNSAFSFEKLRDYYNFLDQYAPAHTAVQCGRRAEGDVMGTVAERDSAWRSLTRTRTMVMIFCLIPMVCVLAWMIYMCFGDGYRTIVTAFEGIGAVLGVILAIICGLAGLAEGGIIGAIIGGLVGYWVPVWIFGLISGIAPWLLVGLVVAGAIYFITRLYKISSDTAIPDRATYDNLYQQAEMYVVCQGFGTTARTFGSRNINPESIFADSRDQAKAQKSRMRKAALGMVLLTAATLAIGIGLMKNVSAIEDGTYGTEYVENVDPDTVAGGYTGEFHGRTATMELVQTEPGAYTFTGKVTINYSTPMTQEVYGRLTGDQLNLTVSDNSIATYTGTVEGATYSGTYTNAAKGTRHEFTFNRL